jgi:hypothetical protein
MEVGTHNLSNTDKLLKGHDAKDQWMVEMNIMYNRTSWGK